MLVRQSELKNSTLSPATARGTFTKGGFTCKIRKDTGLLIFSPYSYFTEPSNNNTKNTLQPVLTHSLCSLFP